MEGYYTARFENKYMQTYDELMRTRKYKSKTEYKKEMYKEIFSVM